MRVGLEDIDVTSCLNVCIVVIINLPPVTLYVSLCGRYRVGGEVSLLIFLFSSLEEKLVKIE